jgi:tetratricopeptide (TPR) repeat protein
MATRTHNAVSTLAASVKDVVTRQERYERGLNLNSLVAYVLFTVLLGGGFFLLYRSRAGRLVMERDQAIRERGLALDEAGEVKKKLAARDEAERKARDFWQLLSSGKKAEAISRYPDVSHEPLTPVEVQVFQQAVARARAEMVDAGHAEGLEAFRNQQWKRASLALKRALAYEDEGPRAAQMRYSYGVALAKQGDYSEAQRQLELALAGGAERTVGTDARYVLASALEMLRQLDRAREEYDRFATGHPGHALALAARRKASELAARLARKP